MSKHSATVTAISSVATAPASPAPMLQACDESTFAIAQIRILAITAAMQGRAVQGDVLTALFSNLDAEISRMKAACGIDAGA